MEERYCFNCMHSDEWDWYGCGLCYLRPFSVVVKSGFVCTHHRFDEDDEGMGEYERQLVLGSQNL